MIVQRHGNIVNIGSIGGEGTLVAAQPGYCATKAALTGRTAALNKTTRQDPDFRRIIEARTPLARFES